MWRHKRFWWMCVDTFWWVSGSDFEALRRKKKAILCQRKRKKCDITLFFEDFLWKCVKFPLVFHDFFTNVVRKNVISHFFGLRGHIKNAFWKFFLRLRRHIFTFVSSHFLRLCRHIFYVCVVTFWWIFLTQPHVAVDCRNPSKSVGIHENPRNRAKSMKIRQEPWKPFEIYGNLRNP